MAYHLTIVFGADAGTVYAVEDGQRCSVGRSEDSNIRLDDEAVAWEHAVLVVEDNRLYCENLSALGTKVNGRPLTDRTRVVPGDRVELAPNAVLTVGSDQTSTSGGGSMITVLALIAVVVIGAGFAATLLWNVMLKEKFAPVTAAEQSADWGGTYFRLERKIAEWTEEKRVPPELGAAFESAWRYESLGEQATAHKAYGQLVKDMMILQDPVAKDKSFAAAASGTGRELGVYLGTIDSEDPATMPWAGDAAHASGLVWFVRTRHRLSTPKKDTSKAFGGI